ncbi:hypothetical protein G6F57_012564 [Rhizopus arrhizus]|uniref:PAN2-PAN3 deadenylation complex subunit PAN3 n=1 Tax=Rhizopus oryzae TaxID=64495 RepID=A0A9P6XD63_RHIOR|nr:hypothetical protein G6F24_002695 [Rhizopus arrhizus]KAG0781066.1 hypothetical protein G6F21_011839 [Rhizopus arrhizus]KAG0805320.1 hypothetical protein G6F20_011999 [Rhizopus arrhizus]KAG0821821.1 hypothetical protein G6F18_012029 [Rhizopus arrhizus]KAG0836565.1 hypothetical protein G6F19_004175 [Rhizopus arrhizus]
MSQYQFIPPPQTTSVIPIVAPSSENSNSIKEYKPISKASNSNSGKRLCRNIIIHGYCKFENKGCEFNHDTSKSIVLPQQQNPLSPENRHTPLADNIHAPVFVPSSTATTQDNTSTSRDPSYRYSAPPSSNSNSTSGNQFHPFNLNPHVPSFAQQGYNNSAMNSNVDPYFYTPSFHPSPTEYHRGPAILPHVANLLPHQRLAQSFFIPDNLNEQLIKRQEIALQTKPEKELPEEVHVYHSLCLLEENPGKFFGHPSWIYKAISRTNGQQYIMIRIEGFRLVNEHTMTMESFTTRAFGDSSLVFIYDYHPNSINLFEAYFTPQAQALLHARLQATRGNALPVPETTLWSFMTQMASALKTIHAAGLSARTMDPTKILMTSKNRLRISCCGVLDVLQYEVASQKVAFHQQEDLLNFGKLLISLACNSLQSILNLSQSFEYITRFYSSDLKNTILYLLSKPSPVKSIDEVIRMIGPRILHDANSTQYYADTLESNLGFELENSRLVRLLSKLGFINERPEFSEDPRWSETGDRYIIKLFREFLFHQVNEVGIPVVDMGHVISCLNKLDAGVDEKILLTSRDDQTSIIVSYKEIKACVNSAFNDIYATFHNNKK